VWQPEHRRRGPQHEEKPAVLRFVPGHVPDAGDARAHDLPADVQFYRVADSDLGVVANLFRNGHFRLVARLRCRPGGAIPELPRDEPLIRLKRLAIGDTELPRQPALLPDGVGVLEHRARPEDANHPRAHQRHDAGRLQDERRDGGLDALGLVLLHIDQHEIGRRRAELRRELGKQVVLHRAHGQHEETTQAHGHQHHAGLVAGPSQAERRVTDGERSRSRQA
jgi:hypothetical protein